MSRNHFTWDSSQGAHLCEVLEFVTSQARFVTQFFDVRFFAFPSFPSFEYCDNGKGKGKSKGKLAPRHEGNVVMIIIRQSYFLAHYSELIFKLPQRLYRCVKNCLEEVPFRTRALMFSQR